MGTMMTFTRGTRGNVMSFNRGTRGTLMMTFTRENHGDTCDDVY